MRRHRSAMLALTLIAGTASAQSAAPTHMSESIRGEIDRLVVIGGTDPAEQEITGTYEKMTPGLYGGISQGAALGSPSMEIGPVNVSFPIPILTLPGAIAGGISGKYRRELQEFRDALAEELAGAANQPLNNSRLALGVFRNLERLPVPEAELFAESTPVPDDTDAIMYVTIDNLTIEVDGEDAVLTTTASLSIVQKSDGMQLYDRVAAYQDRAALGRWTANDNALFRDYANYALHFLGRELAAESFERVRLTGKLEPRETPTVDVARRNPWQGETRVTAPALGWDFELAEAADRRSDYGPWAEKLDPAATFFDVEIYDRKRLVYSRTGVTGTEHVIASPLEPCKTYRWSVRPGWRVDGALRFGAWMRQPAERSNRTPVDIVGRDAAAAPAYIQDFPTLAVDCKGG